MKRINFYIMSISLGMICLVFIEGMMTLGSAFNFESYGVFAWVCQAIAILFTISLSIHIAGKELEEGK
jgi:hypothetical protein